MSIFQNHWTQALKNALHIKNLYMHYLLLHEISCWLKVYRCPIGKTSRNLKFVLLYWHFTSSMKKLYFKQYFLPDINYFYVPGSLLKISIYSSNNQQLRYIHIKLSDFIVLFTLWCLLFTFLICVRLAWNIHKKLHFNIKKYNYIKKIDYSYKQADIHCM